MQLDLGQHRVAMLLNVAYVQGINIPGPLDVILLFSVGRRTLCSTQRDIDVECNILTLWSTQRVAMLQCLCLVNET